jgi:mono/diheme cytochrome c family protein
LDEVFLPWGEFASVETIFRNRPVGMFQKMIDLLVRFRWIPLVLFVTAVLSDMAAMCSADDKTPQAANIQPTPSPVAGKATQAALSQSPLWNCQLLDQNSKIHAFREQSEVAWRVVVFVNGDCPIARSYVPELNRLHEKWNMQSETISLHALWGSPTSSHGELRDFTTKFDVKFPIVFDPLAQIARALKPTHVPEAFVLNADGKVVYRGRIDERWAAPGVKRTVVQSHDLEMAVERLSQNPLGEVASTTPVGCLFDVIPAEELLAAPTPSTDAHLTWSQVTSAIILANCAHCHQSGGVGPFALDNHADVVSNKLQLMAEINGGRMPPWMPDAVCGEFVGQRGLSDVEKKALTLWIERGTPTGNVSEAPPAPRLNSEWELGPPDLIAEMSSEFAMPADGPDRFQNFVIPLGTTTDHVVAAIEFKPGDPSVVHHAICFLDSNGAARKLDAKTPEPGYSSFGSPGFLPSGSIGGWSPGNTPRRLSGHMGRYMKKGSDLVIQIHYHPSGKATKDRSRVGIYFTKNPKNIAAAVWAASYDIDIPAGEKHYERVSTYKLPQPVELLGVIPHMHLLGKSFKADAVLPDGGVEPIIEISQWKYAWQDEFHLAKPMRLPAGATLRMTTVWDNSADNPLNPSRPPKRVTWGEQTTDEMAYGFFLVAAEEPKKLLPLALDNLGADLRNRASHGHPMLPVGTK